MHFLRALSTALAERARRGYGNVRISWLCNLEVDMKRVARVFAPAVFLLLLIGCRGEGQAVEEYLEAAAPLLSEWVNRHLEATMTTRLA